MEKHRKDSNALEHLVNVEQTRRFLDNV